MGSSSWNHENAFNREPIRRFAIATETNEAFLEQTRKPFLFSKLQLKLHHCLLQWLPDCRQPYGH